MTEKNRPAHYRRSLKKTLQNAAGTVSCLFCLAALVWVALNVHPGSSVAATELASTQKANIASRLDAFALNTRSDMLSDLVYIKKVYRIPEEDRVAPAPDPMCFGSTYDPKDILQVITQARASYLLEGQDVIFDANADFVQNTPMHWYCDESLLVICWKEMLEGRVCSCCEVKVADASQFRRKLCEDTYGSLTKAYATELAAQVNAVAAVNADLYIQRDLGVTVYDRQVFRFGEWMYTGAYNQYNAVDNLFVDASGNFHFMHMGEQATKEGVQKYVDDNDILFSIAFGPLLVEDYDLKHIDWYPVGEINEEYSRAGIAQFDDLHYFYMTVSHSEQYTPRCNINEFAALMHSKGVKHAYALDGGQTGELVFDGEPYNHIDFGSERTVSDILYFASALEYTEVIG